MEVDCIPFRKTGYFSKLICDYLEENEKVKPFYHRYPTLKNFREQIKEKAANYNPAFRPVLSKALSEQYSNLAASEATLANIKALAEDNTFTVVTGHQLNLFTGPLYFLYKILSTINLCKQLGEAYPEYSFVPIYWMASEDHDFDEINYFNHEGKKIQWNRNAGGAVGRMNTEGLQEVFEVFAAKIGSTKNANELKELFQKSYLGHENLADATRYLANALFGEKGLVIIDGDDRELKRLMIPWMKKDIFEQVPFKIVTKSIQELEAASSDYKIQVNPREINYFYLGEGSRERVVAKEEGYAVNDTDQYFTAAELQEELVNFPEKFSPNVIARPLYQEVILPNLCYIGGGGELAYWLELKAYFNEMNITFPSLLLRNSALVLTQKSAKKITNLDLEIADLFLNQTSLINKKIRQISNINIDFSPQKKLLEEQFLGLYELANETDPTFFKAVKAQEVKQKKGLDHLENRLLKAQKRKLKDQVIRMTEVQNELFPNYSLQERQLNFSALYLHYGSELLESLEDALDPLKQEFLILRD